MNALLEAALRGYGLEEFIGARARRWRARTVLSILAGSAAIVALVLFAVSVYLLSISAMSPWQAAAAAGLFSLAMAGVLVALAHWLHGRRVGAARRRARAETKKPNEAVLDELLHGGMLHASDLLVTSLIAGIVLGASPTLRSELADLLRGRRDRAAADRCGEPGSARSQRSDGR